MSRDDDSIFVLEGSDTIREISKAPYENEDLLQQLIESHPELLAGQQLDQENPPRWLLVSREVGIRDSKESANRWSIDHMLLDQDGVPTFVEVKRSSDTRIRREVVGQMLEYAANALAHWPPDEIRRIAEQRAGGVDALNDQVVDLLGGPDPSVVEEGVGEFWSAVEENLKEGKVRLLFVADSIPRELRLIIEFLNDKMQDVQVAGIELVQYREGDLRVLVPRVVGQTEASLHRKKRTSGKKTTRYEFIESCPIETRDFFNEVLDGAQSRGLTVYWGQRGFSVRAPDRDGKLHTFLFCFPPGAQGSEVPYIQGYLIDVDDRVLDAEIREALESYGFGGSGEHTRTLKLVPGVLDEARQGLLQMWKAAEHIMNRSPGA